MPDVIKWIPRCELTRDDDGHRNLARVEYMWNVPLQTDVAEFEVPDASDFASEFATYMADNSLEF